MARIKSMFFHTNNKNNSKRKAYVETEDKFHAPLNE